MVDSPVAAKYLTAQLKDRAENEEHARPMQFFDLTTKDSATFKTNLAGLFNATKTMTSGHPIGLIDPGQLEGTNEFGKNCFFIIAVGAFPPHLLKQGAGRLGRSVEMEAGDLVPVDGYKAVHLTTKWQTALTVALKSEGETLPTTVNNQLNKYKAARKATNAEDVETTAKQLVKVDAAMYLPPKPFDLAKTYMEAVLDEEKK